MMGYQEIQQSIRDGQDRDSIEAMLQDPTASVTDVQIQSLRAELLERDREPEIEVGLVVEEWLPTDSDDNPYAPEFTAYVSVDVAIDGIAVRVGCVVGAPEHTHGSVRASGAGVRPWLTVWWADASDHQSVVARHKEFVLSALMANKGRLWREVGALRSS